MFAIRPGAGLLLLARTPLRRLAGRPTWALAWFGPPSPYCRRDVRGPSLGSMRGGSRRCLRPPSRATQVPAPDASRRRAGELTRVRFLPWAHVLLGSPVRSLVGVGSVSLCAHAHARQSPSPSWAGVHRLTSRTGLASGRRSWRFDWPVRRRSTQTAPGRRLFLRQSGGSVRARGILGASPVHPLPFRQSLVRADLPPFRLSSCALTRIVFRHGAPVLLHVVSAVQVRSLPSH